MSYTVETGSLENSDMQVDPASKTNEIVPTTNFKYCRLCYYNVKHLGNKALPHTKTGKEVTAKEHIMHEELCGS